RHVVGARVGHVQAAAGRVHRHAKGLGPAGGEGGAGLLAGDVPARVQRVHRHVVAALVGHVQAGGGRPPPPARAGGAAGRGEGGRGGGPGGSPPRRGGGFPRGGRGGRAWWRGTCPLASGVYPVTLPLLGWATYGGVPAAFPATPWGAVPPVGKGEPACWP